MPRPKLFRTDTVAYHVTSRSNNKEFFYIPTEENWKIFQNCLVRSAEKYETEIHTFVLMSNHYHLILSTPKKNLDKMMKYFLSEVARGIQRASSRINHIMGARYKWTVLDTPYALAYCFKYVLRNPVRAGICSRVEDYRYSSINGDILGLVEGFSFYWKCIPKSFCKRLKWLNEPTPKEVEELVSKAIRRYHFKFSTDSNVQNNLRALKRDYGVEDSATY